MKLSRKRLPTLVRILPSISPPPFSDLALTSFMWGDLNDSAFSERVDEVYEEEVHWRRNLFEVPGGKEGLSFVHEMTCLLEPFSDTTAMESVALKAAMVPPALVLQRSHP